MLHLLVGKVEKFTLLSERNNLSLTSERNAVLA
jgi:hypothetical protein